MRQQYSAIALMIVTSLLCTSTLSGQIFAQKFRGRDAAVGQPGRSASPVVSQNFVVYAPDQLLANKVSQEAERFRKELAIEWLGEELPNWNQRCPITVELGMHAGGETSFAFVMNGNRGVPQDWQMKIYGPADRLLDAVLPHEVTHTIFATHFGRPLPRWADEGACTTVEHESERNKNHRLLIDFLSTSPSRGLPFNRMFTMKNYPHDILPLYAQGYSVAKFLILQKGRRHFLDYVGKGLNNEANNHPLRAWDKATDEFYDYKDLSVLQVAWLDWVRKGSDETAFEKPATPFTYARAEISAPTKIAKSNSSSDRSRNSVEPKGTVASRNSSSWYVQQMKQPSTKTRKVIASGAMENIPVQNSALPIELRATPKTIWR